MWRGQQKPNRTEPKPTFCELRRSGEKSEREARSKVSRTSLFCSWRPPVGAGLGSGSNKIRKKKRATPVICCLGSKGLSKKEKVTLSWAESRFPSVLFQLAQDGSSDLHKCLPMRRGLTPAFERGPFLGRVKRAEWNLHLSGHPNPIARSMAWPG